MAAREVAYGDWKTWVFPILRSETDLCDQFVESLRSCDGKALRINMIDEIYKVRKRKCIELNCLSFMALIPCEKP